MRASALIVFAMLAASPAVSAASEPPKPEFVKTGQGAAAHEGEFTPALRAAVSIAPLKGLVEPLLPPGSTVEILVPVGQSEHTAELSSKSISALVQADFVVTVGRGIDNRIEKVLKDRAPVAPRSRQHIRFAKVPGVARARVMKEEDDHHDHAHDEDGNCLHGEPGVPAADSDPHLWLDPELAKSLVSAAAEELSARSGATDAERGRIMAARDAQLEDLEELDREYREAFAGSSDAVVIVAHDAWRRPAARYGFETLALAGMHAQEPNVRAIERAVTTLRGLSEPERVVFAEPQVNQNAIRRVADGSKARILTLDPLGDGDYFKMMRKNLGQLREGLGLPGGGAKEEAVPAVTIESR